MVSFTLFKSASILAFVATMVSAAPTSKDKCSSFRVTAPNTYFKTTAGQCYQVSYDFGGNTPSDRSWISVDLYEYKTDKFINNLINKAKASGISTPWFNVDLGKYHKSGDYYYLVTYGDSCKPIKTPYFHVEYNKNSPPSKSILLLLSYSASAQQQDICTGFRITSPVEENLKWTAGQCYQVSYDFASVAPFLDVGGKAKISVDVYNAETNVKASNVVEKESLNAFGATKAFNMEAPVTGAYYYLITVFHGTDDEQCEPKRSITFEVNVNPNSPPAQC
ncbi:hypothetical protein MBANPS3_001028 [Mucor bainieri]